MIVYPMLGLGKSAFFARNRTNPNWRQYEMAGIAHIPEPIVAFGLPNQNSADARPLFRAAFDNLARWARRRQARQAAARVPALRRRRRCDRRLRSDQGRRRPLRRRRAPPSCRVAGPRPRRGRAARQSRATQCGEVRQRLLLLRRHVRALQDEELLARYPTRDGYVKRVKRAADDLDRAGLHHAQGSQSADQGRRRRAAARQRFRRVEQSMMRQRTSRCWENP